MADKKDNESKGWLRKKIAEAQESKSLSLVVVFLITFFMITLVPAIFSGPLQINTSDIDISGNNLRYTSPNYVGYLSGGNLYVSNIAASVIVMINESVHSFDLAFSDSIVHIVFAKSSALYHAEWDGLSNSTTVELAYTPVEATDVTMAISSGGIIYVSFTSSSNAKMIFKNGESWVSPYLIPTISGSSSFPRIVCVGTAANFVWSDSRNGQIQPYTRSFVPGAGFGEEGRACEINDLGVYSSIGYYSGLYYVFALCDSGVMAYFGSDLSSLSSSALLIKYSNLGPTYCSSSSNGLVVGTTLGNTLILKTLTSDGWGIAEQLQSASEPDFEGFSFVYLSDNEPMFGQVHSQTIETEQMAPVDFAGGDDTVFNELTVEDTYSESLEDMFNKPALATGDGVFSKLDEKLLETFPEVFETVGEAIPFVRDYPTASLIISGVLGTGAFATVIFAPQFIYRRVRKRQGHLSEGSFDQSFDQY